MLISFEGLCGPQSWKHLLSCPLQSVNPCSMAKCQCYGPLSVFQTYTSPPKFPFIRLFKRPKNIQIYPSDGHGSLPHQAFKVTHAVTLKKKKKSKQILKGFHPTQDKLFTPALPQTHSSSGRVECAAGLSASSGPEQSREARRPEIKRANTPHSNITEK